MIFVEIYNLFIANVEEIDDYYVLHQWHKEESDEYLKSELAKRNQELFERIK